MGNEGAMPGLFAGIGALLGLLPFILLFIDYRKRKEVHKPLIYLAVFGFTMAIALPFLLKSFGIWLALMAPLAVMGYVAVLSIRSKQR